MFEKIKSFKSFISGKIDSATANLGELVDNAKAMINGGKALDEEPIPDVNPDEPIKPEPIIDGEDDGGNDEGDKVDDAALLVIQQREALAESEAIAQAQQNALQSLRIDADNITARLNKITKNLNQNRSDLEKFEGVKSVTPEEYTEIIVRIKSAQATAATATRNAQELNSRVDDLKKSVNVLNEANKAAKELTESSEDIANKNREILEAYITLGFKVPKREAAQVTANRIAANSRVAEKNGTEALNLINETIATLQANIADLEQEAAEIKATVATLEKQEEKYRLEKEADRLNNEEKATRQKQKETNDEVVKAQEKASKTAELAQNAKNLLEEAEQFEQIYKNNKTHLARIRKIRGEAAYMEEAKRLGISEEALAKF